MQPPAVFINVIWDPFNNNDTVCPLQGKDKKSAIFVQILKQIHIKYEHWMTGREIVESEQKRANYSKN